MKSASGGAVHPLGAESINHDIALLSCRIADLSSGRRSGSESSASSLGHSLVSTAVNVNPPMLSSQSQFVSGLRSIASSSSSSTNAIAASSSKSFDDLRAEFSPLLGKVSELDRLVLKLTEQEPPSSDVGGGGGGGTGRTRKQQGADLISLPMHLQVLDRLMDLYHKSKRVTVISNNSDASSYSSRSSDTKSNSMKANIYSDGESSENNKDTFNGNIAEELQFQIEKKDALLIVAQASLASANEEVYATRTQLSDALSTNKLLEDRAINYEAEKGQILAEIARMNERLAIETKVFEENTRRDTELRMRELEDRYKMDLNSMQLKLDESIVKLASIEKEQERQAMDEEEQSRQLIAQTQHSFFEVIKDKIQCLKSNVTVDSLIGDAEAAKSSTNCGLNYEQLVAVSSCHIVSLDRYSNLSATGFDLFSEFDDQLTMKFSKLCEIISILYSLKDGLDGELQTYQLERTLLNRDFATLSSQLHAQKTAYQALESENVTAQRKLLQLSSSSEDAAINNARIEDLQETIMSLQSELLKNSRRMMTYDKLPDRIAELDMKLSEVTKQLLHVTSERDQVTVDLETYKKLSESLKNKIKENWGKAVKGGVNSVNSGGEGGGREFMDSFEEVMQEEMMAMKVAFETKLKIAREESEAMSRKHQLEIRNIQNR